MLSLSQLQYFVCLSSMLILARGRQSISDTNIFRVTVHEKNKGEAETTAFTRYAVRAS